MHLEKGQRGGFEEEVKFSRIQQGMERYVRDECNFSLLGQCPAKFTLLDSKPLF